MEGLSEPDDAFVYPQDCFLRVTFQTGWMTLGAMNKIMNGGMYLSQNLA